MFIMFVLILTYLIYRTVSNLCTSLCGSLLEPSKKGSPEGDIPDLKNKIRATISLKNAINISCYLALP